MANKKKKTSNALEIQNAAKTLYANIQFASIDDPIRVVGITSAVPNEGKSTMTLNLGVAVAGSGKRTLIVEGDMRRRSVGHMLGCSTRHGVYAVMAGQRKLEDVVVSTGTPNLFFLDAEPNIPNPADLLSSRAYARLAQEISAAFDFVIFDTPPVGTFVDAAVLSRLVDGIILVVKVGGAKRDELLAAYDQLTKAGANILGACATFCEDSGSEYYYAYYNKDNKRIDPTSVEEAPPRSRPQAQSAPRGRVPQGYSPQAPGAQKTATPRRVRTPHRNEVKPVQAADKPRR